MPAADFPPVWGMPPPTPRTDWTDETRTRHLIAAYRDQLDKIRDIELMIGIVAKAAENLPRGSTTAEADAVFTVARLTARMYSELELLVQEMLRVAADVLPLFGSTTDIED